MAPNGTHGRQILIFPEIYGHRFLGKVSQRFLQMNLHMFCVEAHHLFCAEDIYYSDSESNSIAVSSSLTTSSQLKPIYENIDMGVVVGHYEEYDGD